MNDVGKSGQPDPHTENGHGGDLNLTGLKCFSESKEEILRAIETKELEAKYEILWRAYSKIELAIGVSKLATRGSEKPKLGSFRILKRSKRKTKVRLDGADVQLNEDLNNALIELDGSMACYGDSEFDLGLERARKARDILKIALLERERTASK